MKANLFTLTQCLTEALDEYRIAKQKVTKLKQALTIFYQENSVADQLLVKVDKHYYLLSFNSEEGTFQDMTKFDGAISSPDA